MNQKKTVGILAAVFVLLLGGALLLYHILEGKVDSQQLAGQDDTQKQEQTVPAPDFTVYDAQGSPVSLSNFLGKPIVLNFWASWCGPCQREMPDFQEVYEQMGDQVQFLMVNATGGRETLDTAKAFIEKSDYTFPVFYDTSESASVIYSVYSLPTTYFIDGEGNIVTWATGALNKELLKKGIAMTVQ